MRAYSDRLRVHVERVHLARGRHGRQHGLGVATSSKRTVDVHASWVRRNHFLDRLVTQCWVVNLFVAVSA